MLRRGWTVGIVAGALLLGAGCGGQAQEQTPEAQFMALGQRTYKQVCITCHQSDGKGISGVYPTLHQTAWTTGNKGRLIRLVLSGAQGPMEVKGTTYDQIMQPLGYLSDDQIAAVLTFVRQSFGNDASAVTPEEVARVRATLTQEEPWQPEVLWEQTGIPDAPPAP